MACGKQASDEVEEGYEGEGHPSGCFLRAGPQTSCSLKAEAPLAVLTRRLVGLTC